MLEFDYKRIKRVFEQIFNNPEFTNLEERSLRFGEEVQEFLQVCGITREQAHALVDQVHDKPVGEFSQELGGLLVTLGTLLAYHHPQGTAEAAFEKEIRRIELPETQERIRQKFKSKSVVSSKLRG